MISPNPHSLQLTDAERKPKWININGTLADGVSAFQSDPDLRILPVVDDRLRPIGGLFEKDIRRLLLNPYGHALLKNRSFNADLAQRVRECPIMAVTSDIGSLVEHYRRCDGREGMILTVDGKLWATLTNRRLLLLAAEHEKQAQALRLERAERIARAGQDFELHAEVLSEQMTELAGSVQRLAEDTANRASTAGDRASSVAAAAIQTRDSLTNLADRGSGLALAFGRIQENVAINRRAAASAALMVGDGRERAHALLEAARSIDAMMALISDIAGSVNLLSLNATIEAARAGPAGSGFAVVAGEIRKLSDETQGATVTIGSDVRALRKGIERVADDYAKMVDAVDEIAAAATMIDKSVTKEADTTRLIARSVSDAGEASITIEQAVSTIAVSAQSASSSARELNGLASDLRSGASSLGKSVSSFLGEVRKS